MIWAVLILWIPLCATAQEEESAEFFLEEYTDEFQNLFFEALKHKGIQNYDRAAEKFLECKKLEPDNSVLDHELARTYYLDKKYNLAEGYALSAVEKNPYNYWYLEHLMRILEKQGNTLDAFSDRIPIADQALKSNLVRIYYQKAKYEDALQLLEELPKSDFNQNLKQKIQDSLKKGAPPVVRNESKREDTVSENPVMGYKNRIEKLISNSDYGALRTLAEEAVERYPLQPYFKYAYGRALIGTEKLKEGIEVLEAALDFVFEDNALKNKIYTALAEGYTALGNLKKASEYSNKIEPRS